MELFYGPDLFWVSSGAITGDYKAKKVYAF